MKQKILIVEDDPIQNDSLRHAIVAQYPDWNIISSYNYDDALAHIKNSVYKDHDSYTLFLFDVQLSREKGDRGGFLLAEEVRKLHQYYRTPVLFLTAVSDEGGFALSNYHCYNYISKPYTMQDILSQLDQMLITGYLETTLDICDSDRIHHNLSPEDILYIESKGHTLVMHMKQDTLVTREYNLSTILELLGYEFVQIHKRYIVQIKKITHVDKVNMCINIGTTMIPIGRAYKSNLNL